jgi:signal transduction histidine kinase
MTSGHHGPGIIPASDASASAPEYRGRMFRPVLRSQVVVDLLVAAVFGALVLLQSRYVADYWQIAVVTALFAVAVALRRASPALALTIAWAAAIVQMTGGQYPGTQDIGISAVVYATGAYGSRRVRIAGLVSALVGSVTAGLYIGLRDYTSNGAGAYSTQDLATRIGLYVLVGVALLLLPWIGGVLRRSRQVAQLSREAQLLAQRDAARADRAVAVEQERVRIARDMHDIVAHSLAVVIAQADGARYASKADPAVADQALGTISSTARRALGDVRELLGALRHEQGTTPTPDVDDIARLVDEMREVGLDVDIDLHGDPSTLPTSTQLAVYRIVQESLTNAYKHGERGTPVHASLTYRPDTVEIDVVNRRSDDGRAGPGTGHGLVGMRERATMSGGTMTAGPRGQDFAVAVRMPAHPATGQMPRGLFTSTDQERTAP